MDKLPDRRPNVIWIITDQHRAQALGWNGDPNLHTPAIDNLARNGTVFSRAVAGAPWCTPFRASLLTGRYPHQVGCVRTPSRLDPAIPTIAEPFRQNGYHTAWVGKWHVNGSNSSTHFVPPGERGGFDYWVGYENNNKQYDVWVHGDGIDETMQVDGYETAGLSRVFVDHITAHVGENDEYQPFFGVLSVQPPHSPYVAAHERRGINPSEVELRPNVPHSNRVRQKARRDIAGYSAMVEDIDAMVAEVCEALQTLGIFRDTYVMFFSDHGDMLGSHGQWEKSSPWEESIRIPMIISTAGGHAHIKTGDLDYPMNHVDIAPTSLGLCGIAAPGDMAGYDFSPHIVHQSRWTEYHDNGGDAVAPPDSALLQQIPRKFHRHSVNRAWRGIVTRDGWKYICTPGNDWLLFNLNDDPYEMCNLCYDIVFQDEKERLHQQLQDLLMEQGDDFPLPDISLD